MKGLLKNFYQVIFCTPVIKPLLAKRRKDRRDKLIYFVMLDFRVVKIQRLFILTIEQLFE